MINKTLHVCARNAIQLCIHFTILKRMSLSTCVTNAVASGLIEVNSKKYARLDVHWKSGGKCKNIPTQPASKEL